MHWLQSSASKISLLLTAAILRRLKHRKMMHRLDFSSLLLHTFHPWHMSASQRKSLAKRFCKHDTLKSLSNDMYVQVSPQVFLWPCLCRDWRVKEVWWWSCCGPCYWAKSWRTTRNRERRERERVAAVWPGPGLPGQWTPQPRRRLQSIAMGRALLSSGQASLFVYHKKAVYVIPHNTQPSSWARRNQGEILWKKKISNSISRTRCKQVFLSNLFFMEGL